MPDTFAPSLATAWDIAVDRLAPGADILDGVYPMTVTGGVVLPAVADDGARVALETADWKPRLLTLLREELGRALPVPDIAGVVDHQQQERSSSKVPR
ncbi:hypothetical protein J7F03_36110 [Streptomyces sp. ISL-43]|uniref:hypothetical protein n=1 Tax=Streptomyces sp. ISL-43 TaxID=2819183 RepID=UPI001BE733E9|nr:hypothetical protein [Streptomyces sp. ISL-43]MBT2452387.1 hypothetical protein [Streptomyces sp. ISL-43]